MLLSHLCRSALSKSWMASRYRLADIFYLQILMTLFRKLAPPPESCQDRKGRNSEDWWGWSDSTSKPAGPRSLGIPKYREGWVFWRIGWTGDHRTYGVKSDVLTELTGHPDEGVHKNSVLKDWRDSRCKEVDRIRILKDWRDFYVWRVSSSNPPHRGWCGTENPGEPKGRSVWMSVWTGLTDGTPL